MNELEKIVLNGTDLNITDSTARSTADTAKSTADTALSKAVSINYDETTKALTITKG